MKTVGFFHRRKMVAPNRFVVMFPWASLYWNAGGKKQKQ
jgi:hypothetical protein